MKILGIDPGTKIVGYAVLEVVKGKIFPKAFGAIRASAKDSVPDRLKKIYQDLTEIIQQYQPEVVAIEKVFCGKNMQSAIRIGEGRGVAFLAAANACLDVHEYDATTIKKAVSGTGGAHKTQVQAMVQAILSLPVQPEPTDASDALAIAICHYQHSTGLHK